MALSGLVLRWTKRLLVGRPMRSERLGETLLPKKLAMPVFCSDPLSSNAYATEEILRALSLGGLALLFLAPWVALAVVVLLAVVVASYRQTCYAYPTGGGAYAVSRANLGRNAALVAASARSEEHTSELQSHHDIVCRLLLEKKKNNKHKKT